MDIDSEKGYNLRKRKRKTTEDDGDKPPFQIVFPFPMVEMEKTEKSSKKKPIILQTDEEKSFFHALTKQQQRNYADCMRQVMELTPSTPLKFHILGSTLSPSYKRMALQKLDMLQNMNSRDSEYTKLKNWVDGLMMLPFGKYKDLPVSMQKDGRDVCSEFLSQSLGTLDATVYGMPEVKTQILQVLSQWMTNPLSTGQVLALQGSPGVGKTSVVKDGIANILGRPFFFVPLGGAADASFFRGHSYTYEGSQWGKIADILMKSQCMNPIIYFDELDKVSNTEIGKEIIGILTHLTDKSQNGHFNDRYFNDIDLDLSRVLFVFSYNDDSMISPILRDRLTVIRLPGYDLKGKKEIAVKHIIPKLYEQYGIGENEVQFPSETLDFIIKNFGEKEKGVRELIRALEMLMSKINLIRLGKVTDMEALGLKLGTLLFPLIVSIAIAKKLLPEQSSEMSIETQRMYV